MYEILEISVGYVLLLDISTILYESEMSILSELAIGVVVFASIK
jgi:hypothetical protein